MGLSIGENFYEKQISVKEMFSKCSDQKLAQQIHPCVKNTSTSNSPFDVKVTVMKRGAELLPVHISDVSASAEYEFSVNTENKDGSIKLK